MPPQAPSDNTQSQSRPSFSTHHRSTSSITNSDSPASTPPAHNLQHKVKGEKKHVVGAARLHGRVASGKGLHKLARNTQQETSGENLRKLHGAAREKNNSTTSLRKNHSEKGLKRNKSSADVETGRNNSGRRPKSADGQSKKSSVHFELGVGGKSADDEGWEEASSSASPALSRAASRSGYSSAKQSADNSRLQSPLGSPTKAVQGNGIGERKRDSSADAKVITQRLLQRTPSHHATTTKMSMATATPVTGHTPSSSFDKATIMNGKGSATSGNTELISRFVSGSGTPGENSPAFLQQQHLPQSAPANTNGGGLERARSMGNLTNHDGPAGSEDEESALLPRSRKSSTSGGTSNAAYNSRTQQKLWLQRASSNMEPQHNGGVGGGLALNILNGGLGMGMGVVGGNMYDGRDPRIKVQLERTGLEYLVVRRYQDPVGKSLKRLEKLAGGGKKIPDGKSQAKGDISRNGSLRERGGVGRRGTGISSAKHSYDGSQDERNPVNSGGSVDDETADDGVGAILRSLWEKNFDLSASSD